jgi:hypothetical protein
MHPAPDTTAGEHYILLEEVFEDSGPDGVRYPIEDEDEGVCAWKVVGLAPSVLSDS